MKLDSNRHHVSFPVSQEELRCFLSCIDHPEALSIVATEAEVKAACQALVS